MTNKLSVIRVNDIFDELIDENKRLKQCLNVFIQFKTFVDLVFKKLKNNLDSNDLQEFNRLKEVVKEVISNSEDIISNEPLITSKKKTKTKLKLKKSAKSVDKTLKISEKSNIKSEEFIIETTEDGNHPFVCHFIGCGKGFPSEESLSTHTRSHVKTRLPPKKFLCSVEGCNYRTDIRQRLDGHLNVHKGVKPYKCQTCGKGFTHIINVRNHERYAHSSGDGEETYVCPLNGCTKVCKTRKQFLFHQTSHEKGKQWSCSHPNCDYRTVTERFLQQHIKSKHTERDPKPFKCSHEGCDKAFSVKYYLKLHIKGIHGTGYDCTHEGCAYHCRTSCGLRNHIKAEHYGVKWSCEWPGCEFTTSKHTSLNTHKWVHLDSNFSCDWPQCGKRFKRKEALDLHTRRHNNDKRYVCVCVWPGCQYRCVDSGNFQKHKRIHEKNLNI